MTKYIMNSEGFTGNITFIYNSKGNLVELMINSHDMPDDLHTGVLNSLHIFRSDVSMREFALKFKKPLHKEQIDLSFERLKNMYAHARDTFKAEPTWNRMKEEDRYHTLVNLKAYNRYCKRNPTYTKMYLAKYLNGHHKTNWDMVPDLEFK